MEIQVFDDKRKRILRFKIGSNNCVSRRYLSTMFPGILGLYYEDTDDSLHIVELNENDSFVYEWNPEIIYKPSFSNSRRSSQSSTSWPRKCLNGLLAIGVIVTIWIGSMIPSLWANIYEETLRKLSIYVPSNASTSSSEQTMLLSIRIVILIIFSAMYLLLAVLITPTAIRTCWGGFKSWLFGIDAESLTYNALFRRQSSN